MKANNLVGQVFSRLTVVADGGRCKKQNVLWLCRCECGETTSAFAYDLRAGKVKSCGCLNRESRNFTHGQAHSKTYNVWATMIQRCTNPNDQNWERYGGRGITVCKKWRTFEGFFADMGDKPDGYSIERKNNDRGYELSNCAWIPRSEQGKNTSGNRKITIDGITKNLIDWCRDIGVTRQAVFYHTKKGVSHAEAIKKIRAKRGVG